MNRIGRDNFTGFSAGMQPADQLDPLVREILLVAQYPTDDLQPKHWSEFAKADAPPLDFVFTLCDPKAGEPLPHWPGRPITADWSYPNPETLRGELWERRRELVAMLAGLERQLMAFIQLPAASTMTRSARASARTVPVPMRSRTNAPIAAPKNVDAVVIVRRPCPGSGAK
jgi:arsenate reductase (thioredoxin)